MDLPSSALNRFLHRLSLGGELSSDAHQDILALKYQELTVPTRHDVLHPGATTDHSVLVSKGLLARYDLMRNGHRSFTALHIPGDMCDLHSVVSPTAGWGLTTLSDTIVHLIKHDDLRVLVHTFPEIAFAFWRDTTLDASILAKWKAIMGGQNGIGRVSHLIAEMGLRMEAAGAANRARYKFKATQEQIGEMTGLTSVHVNRMLRQLRDQGIADVGRGIAVIHNWEKLCRLADFSARYLLHIASRD